MTVELEPGQSFHELTIPSTLSFLAPTVVDSLIRVGRANDGGYVVPASSVQAADFLISLGLSDDWSFDEHFKRLNPSVRIHAYDHTISKSMFRSSVIRGFLKMLIGKTTRDNFSRRRALLASYKNFFRGDVHHFKERIHHRLSLPHDVTLDKVFQRANSNRVYLKIDIEGSEYTVIDAVLKHSAKVVGLAIEFHHTGVSRQEFLEVMRKLQEHFEVVHLHANNFSAIGPDNLPEVLEMTFIRKADCEQVEKKKRNSLPIPLLDSPNSADKSDYRITFACL